MYRRPHDPIESKAEDKFGREGLVDNLERAMLTPYGDCSDARATGVVVGLTGPWGSGKSSVLNLLKERLDDRSDCVVIRFVPWVVQSGPGLIEYFFRLVAKSLEPDFVPRDQIVEDILAYGRLASRGVSAFSPESGGLLAILIDGVYRRLRSKPDIFELREKIDQALNKRCINIVVLIDEIDRLTNEEIREVARLIRAVGDLDRISYALAYDDRRVAEALGTYLNVGPDTTERSGRSYLAKIVNLEIPMPLPTEYMIEYSMDQEIARIVAGTEYLQSDHIDSEDYKSLRNKIIETLPQPRDITRLVSAFEALYRMIGIEVYWVDLLAYCLLRHRSPEVVEIVATHPDDFVANPASEKAQIARVLPDNNYTETLFARINFDDIDPLSQNLFKYIFPHLFNNYDGKDRLDLIRYRSPLIATLRLGLDTVSEEYRSLSTAWELGADITDALAALIDAGEADRLDRIIDYIARDEDPQKLARFWDMAFSALTKSAEGKKETWSLGSISNVVETGFIRHNRSDKNFALNVIKNSIDRNWRISVNIIRHHFFYHGLYRWTHRNSESGGCLTPEDTVYLAEKQKSYILEKIEPEKLLTSSVNSHSIWFLHDTSAGNENEIAEYLNLGLKTIASQSHFMKLMFGPGYSTEFSSVEFFLSKDELVKMVQQLQSLASKDPALEYALEAARRRWLKNLPD